MSQLKLLAVFAHPDDESMGMGGTLAKYAAEGVETHLVCASRGEVGWFGPEEQNPGPERLGQLRTEELQNAINALGMTSLSFLNYIDGQVDQATPAEAIAKIVTHIRRIQPQVVVTFPHDGNYGHPDHIAICQFSTAAVMAAANPNYMDSQRQAAHQVSKLYYRAWGLAEAAIYQQVFGDLGMTIDDVKRSATPWHEWAITTRIDATPYWQQVQAAVDSHRSQLGAYERFAALSSEEQRTLWGSQNFYRALSLVNGGREAENDLFMGIAATVDMNSLFTLNGLSEVFRPAVFASSVRS